MHSTIPFGVASAREIQRRRCQEGESTATGGIAINFGKHAKLAWPFKTAAHIASIGKISERHAARILSGEFEAPASIATALIAEIFKRQ
jgi:hypothetical protein